MSRLLSLLVLVFALLFLPAALAATSAHAHDKASIWMGAASGPLVLAHAGGLAKDSCHRDKKAGERHWHKKGSRKRAGPCVKAGGKTWQLTGNAICARQRAAFAADKEDGWRVDWKRHAQALKNCIVRLPDKPRPRRNN